MSDITISESRTLPSEDTYTGTAAAQVIAIPELLEHILDRVATNELFERSCWDPTPSYALFRLLRVNKTFRDTIEGSMKLLCHMGLRHPEPKNDTSKHELVDWHTGCLRWLFNLFEDPPLSSLTGQRLPGDRIYNFRLPPFSLMHSKEATARLANFDEFHQKYGTSCASWRKIKTGPSTNTTIIVTPVVDLDMEGGVVLARWRFTGNAPLGEVYDRYCTLVEALHTLLAEHQATKDKFAGSVEEDCDMTLYELKRAFRPHDDDDDDD